MVKNAILPNSRIHAAHIPELIRLAAERFESLPAFATRRPDGLWDPLSFRELYERGQAIAEGLIGLGVEAREPIGLFADNRVEWMLADTGIQLCGGVNTPRGTDLTDDELIYIITHSGMKTAFVETARMAQRCRDLQDHFPALKELIQLDVTEAPPEGVRTLQELEAEGQARLDAGATECQQRQQGVKSEDLFTLIYTSGTTGNPKGVMLSHTNMMSQIDHVPIQLSCTDRVLSILPIWHIFERMFEVFAVSHGACTYYTNIRWLGEDLKQVEPTFMGSAPRLWENLRDRILSNVKKAHPIRRALFHIALFLGTHYREALFLLRDQDERLQPVSAWLIGLQKAIAALQWTLLLPLYGFFNAAVLEAVRRKVGGSLKGTISGGGALPPEVDRFFNAIGIPVLEGYGLTETSPVVAVRTPERLVRGTVGPLIPETEVRIVDLETNALLYPNPEKPHDGLGLRGEILLRGPQIMQGYFKNAEATQAVLDEEGWFRTGDIGMMTFNETLKILGRRKATLVLRNGENVEPEPIEMKLKLSPLIEDCVVVGQDAKHLGALVLPDLKGCWDAGFEFESHATAALDEALREYLLRKIRTAQANPREFKRFEVVQDIRLLTKPLKVGVERTNLYKAKRHVIHDRYADQIKEMCHD